jgi:hypothetical protein
VKLLSIPEPEQEGSSNMSFTFGYCSEELDKKSLFSATILSAPYFLIFLFRISNLL